MFYTYLWLREDGTPYYVGKGHGKRAFVNHRKGNRLKPPRDKTLILVQYFESEEDAFFAEMFLIAAYGRKKNNTGCLGNLTEGGENPPKQDGNTFRRGTKASEETRKKQSEAKKGKEPWNKGTKGVMAAWNKGLTGVNNNQKGRSHTNESKIRMSASAKVRDPKK